MQRRESTPLDRRCLYGPLGLRGTDRSLHEHASTHTDFCFALAPGLERDSSPRTRVGTLWLANCAHLARSSSRLASDVKRSRAFASVPPDKRRWCVAEGVVRPDNTQVIKAIVGARCAGFRLGAAAAQHPRSSSLRKGGSPESAGCRANRSCRTTPDALSLLPWGSLPHSAR
jgi:hypothetical protein